MEGERTTFLRGLACGERTGAERERERERGGRFLRGANERAWRAVDFFARSCLARANGPAIPRERERKLIRCRTIRVSIVFTLILAVSIFSPRSILSFQVFFSRANGVYEDDHSIDKYSY